MAKRVGHCMRAALRYCDQPGGRSRAELARLVGPHKSLCYGYASVNRLIRTELILTGSHQGRCPGPRGLMVAPIY